MKACTDTVDMSVLFCGTEFLPPNVHIDLLGEALKLWFFRNFSGW